MKKKNRQSKHRRRKEIPSEAEQERLNQEIDEAIAEMESGIKKIRGRLKRIQDKLGKIQRQIENPESDQADQQTDHFGWIEPNSSAWSA
ncbi:MAG: hypothetical protein AAGN35_09420 [Bacteroidota bacterium]